MTLNPPLVPSNDLERGLVVKSREEEEEEGIGRGGNKERGEEREKRWRKVKSDMDSVMEEIMVA